MALTIEGFERVLGEVDSGWLRVKWPWICWDDLMAVHTDGEELLDVPERPCLCCVEHESICEVVHSLLNRVISLEQRIRQMEERDGS